MTCWALPLIAEAKIIAPSARRAPSEIVVFIQSQTALAAGAAGYNHCGGASWKARRPRHAIDLYQSQGKREGKTRRTKTPSSRRLSDPEVESNCGCDALREKLNRDGRQYPDGEALLLRRVSATPM